MDELLSFMEDLNEDEEIGDRNVTDHSSRPMLTSPLKHRNSLPGEASAAGSSSSLSPSKKAKGLTFVDVFGSPDKRDVKELGLTSSQSSTSSSISNGSRRQTFSGTSSATSTSSSWSSSQLELTKAIQKDSNVPYKPDNSLIVIDPFSRNRLVKSTLNIHFEGSVTAETVLKERNIGLEFVNLSTFPVWHKGKGRDTKNFWVSAVLSSKSPGVRKSAKGNDYSIWEISDLKNLDKKFTLFLFSAASSSNVSATPVGSLIDITTPSIMQDSENGTIKFSVNNGSQIRFIGTAKDFGYCQSTRKDGKKCTMVVNTWECSFCIHHASAELKKLNIGKKKGKSKSAPMFPNKSFNGGGWESQQSLKDQGVTVANFGTRPFGNQGPTSSRASLGGSSRMALQGGKQEMQKNPLKFGNPDTVKFVANSGDHPLLKKDPVPKAVRKSLDLNPLRTRHLTNKDRELLQMLDSQAASSTSSSKGGQSQQSQSSQDNCKKQSTSAINGPPTVVSDMITNAIVNNPNAASRNFMQYLTLQHAPKDQVQLSSSNKSTRIAPLVMNREKVKSMQKALNFVKAHGPITKSNPNDVTGRKRKASSQQDLPTSSKKSSRSNAKNCKIDVEFDFESDEFKKILTAKSAHDEELDDIQKDEYFEKLEKKEALENKLLSTYSIETNAVMCRQCKYVALSQSEFCKDQLHEVRLVKARKRFFKCKDCGNRTMSLDRLPKRGESATFFNFFFRPTL